MTSSAGEQSPEVNGSGAKRKSVDLSGQPRAKRNRYISIACNECKRRKIKCNGQMPCQRCGNLNLECVYAPNCCAANFKESDEYRKMSAHMSKLQEQVDTLFANLNSLRADLANSQPQIDPSLQQHSLVSQRASIGGPQPSPNMLAPPRARTESQSRSRPPTFRGPTSVEFNLGVAKNSLQTMGIAPNEDTQGGTTTDVTPATSPPPSAPHHPDKDPIWQVSREEALRLVKLFEDEMHEMYPTVSIPLLLAHVNQLYTYMEAALRNGLVQPSMPGLDSIDDDDTNILKLILAIAMMLEGSGKSELGSHLWRYVQPNLDALLLGHAGYKGIRMLSLAAMYEFHCDNEHRAWRIIGLTVRLCIEIGLHRRETYDALPDDEERQSVILLFWAIYCLDRRWSFGTGMPFALQDNDIDPNLPKPDGQSVYLTAMIAHFAIASKVWHAMGTDPAKPTISREEIDYLDYQVQTWHRNLPNHLRWDDPPQMPQGLSTPGQHRLQIILYLRANAMRILIYRPVLHSVTSIMHNQAQAQTVVDVAKETIRILSRLNQTSKMYRTSQVLFNAFLTSALAVLFLAVSHAPAVFAEQVREEFYLALDLVRGFSRGSWVSKQLWKTIRVLKEVGPKLGLVMKSKRPQGIEPPSRHMLQRGNSQHDDPSHSAAVAMAGLAGHNVDEAALFGPGTPWAMASVASNSPDGMVHDLTNLFEAAGGYAGANGGYGGMSGMNGNGANASAYPMGGTDGNASMDMMGGAFGSEDELSRILRDLF